MKNLNVRPALRAAGCGGKPVIQVGHHHNARDHMDLPPDRSRIGLALFVDRPRKPAAVEMLVMMQHRDGRRRLNAVTDQFVAQPGVRLPFRELVVRLRLIADVSRLQVCGEPKLAHMPATPRFTTSRA
jgi:hypothetical protein